MVIEKIRIDNVFDGQVLISKEAIKTIASDGNLISSVTTGHYLWSLTGVYVAFESIFNQNKLTGLPTNKDKLLRNIVIWFDGGIVYTLSLYPDKDEIFSEQIEKNGSVLLYRDPSDLYTTGTKGVGPWQFGRSLLDRSGPACPSLWRELSIGVYRESHSTPKEWDTNGYDFTPPDLPGVNKIMTTLFNDSVSEVYSDGSYKSAVGDVVMSLDCAGSGYHAVLSILRLLCKFRWKQTFFLDATVLSRLHPIIRRPFLEMLKWFQPGGEKISIFFCDPMEGEI